VRMVLLQEAGPTKLTDALLGDCRARRATSVPTAIPDKRMVVILAEGQYEE